MNCPKCGSEKSMRGPRYVKDAKGERLKHVCGVCGYTTESPCADANNSSKKSVVKVEMPAYNENEPASGAQEVHHQTHVPFPKQNSPSNA
jgi:transcription elongation factor Elf1